MTDYSKRRLVGYLGTAALAMLLILGICWWLYDWHLVEKMLTKLLLPSGMVWSGLLLASLVAWAQRLRGWAVGLTCLFVAYWALSSVLVADLVMGTLERRYVYTDFDQVEPFDVVIVLGGATSSDFDGNVWIGDGGDRLMLASRLFHRGKVQKLLTTGQAYDWSENVDMSEATHRIWTDVGIPADAIQKIGGRNTSQEMQNIKELFGEAPPARVGLLTSAFHLPRAERLAKAAGLEVIPIAAGFYGPMMDPVPLALLPNYNAIKLWDLAGKEFLAHLISR